MALLRRLCRQRNRQRAVYDVKAFDRLVTRVAREIRFLELALTSANAKTTIEGYEQDDTVLGELA
jgi:hypothetical protein